MSFYGVGVALKDNYVVLLQESEMTAEYHYRGLILGIYVLGEPV